MQNDIVLATRFGAESEAPARVAARLAGLTGGRVTIVYVARELAAVTAAGIAIFRRLGLALPRGRIDIELQRALLATLHGASAAHGITVAETDADAQARPVPR
jgi:hypothetical protein